MRSLLIAVCCLVFAFAAFAQTDRGTITGTVSDPDWRCDRQRGD